MGRWTKQGFMANSMAYYKEQIKKLFVEAFGPEFLLDDTLPQGILITRLAELAYGLDMDGVEVFAQLNPNTASGVWLDVIGGLRGIPRSTGTPQLATVAIKCNPDNFIPFTITKGHIFSIVGSGETFEVIAGKTITEPETVLSLQYTEAGDSTASIGAKMQTSGAPQITDIEITYLMAGAQDESDLDYRARLRATYPTAGQTIENIEGLIRELQFVKAVGHNYNDTAEEVDTLPAYSTEFMAVPKPGTDETLFKESVASIILNNKMPGAPTAGNTSVDIADVFGTQKTVKFTIPEEVKLQIKVQVGTPEETGYIDLSGLPDIIEAICAYINSLDIGKDVSYSRCMAPLTADKGFDVLSFKIRKRPVAPAWDSSKEDYALGTVVEYNNDFYIAKVESPDGNPANSSDWGEYTEGWVENQNFSIGSRQYAAIIDTNVSIGA